MRPEPDFEWSFCGEPYRIRFFPLVARFEVCIEGAWVRILVCHRPTQDASFGPAGLPSVFRKQLTAALEQRQPHVADARCSRSSRRRRARKEAA